MVTQGDCEASSSSSNVTQPSTVKEEESKAENGEGVSRQELGLAVIFGKFLLEGPLGGLPAGKGS